MWGEAMDEMYPLIECKHCGWVVQEWHARPKCSRCGESFPVGNTQGEDPACGRTPKGAAEGISGNAEPQDLDSRAVLPSSPKPPALRRRGAPEPSLPCQSEADLPASMTSQEHGHRS